MNKKAMLDTVIFNRLLDGKLTVASLQGFDLYTTPMQFAELKATSDPIRRADLLAVFAQVAPEEKDIETVLWCVTPWFRGPYLGTAGLWEPIFNAMQALPKRRKWRERKFNHADAVIAEAAILNDCILLTDDQDLLSVVPQFGGKVMNPLASQQQCSHDWS